VDGNWTFRGDTADKIAAIANSYWADWQTVVADSKESGGMLWCHADYNSPVNSNPEGVVDAYRIPKSSYYLFRKNWTGVSYDNDIPVTGTAATLKIEADTNRLVADGSDCAFIYVSVRDASGRCIHTGYGSKSTTTVNFTVSANATAFGNASVKVNGGKCAILIRSTTTPGPITVSASATGLAGASVQITSVADTYNPDDYPFVTPVVSRAHSPGAKNISFVQTGHVVRIKAQRNELNPRNIAVINMKGQNIAVALVAGDRELLVDTGKLTCGPYILCIKNASNGKAYLRPFFIAK
jgi:hypothetical protein